MEMLACMFDVALIMAESLNSFETSYLLLLVLVLILEDKSKAIATLAKEISAKPIEEAKVSDDISSLAFPLSKAEVEYQDLKNAAIEKLQSQQRRFNNEDYRYQEIQTTIKEASAWDALTGTKKDLEADAKSIAIMRDNAAKQISSYEEALIKSDDLLLDGDIEGAIASLKEAQAKIHESNKSYGKDALAIQQQRNEELAQKEVILARTETATRMVRDGSVMAATAVATGGLGVAGAVAVGGGLAVTTNAIEQTGSVALGSKSANEALRDGAMQLGQDTILVASTATGVGLARTAASAGKGALIIAEVSAGTAAGSEAVTIGYQEATGQTDFNFQQDATSVLLSAAGGAVGSLIGIRGNIAREGAKSIAGKLGALAGEVGADLTTTSVEELARAASEGRSLTAEGWAQAGLNVLQGTLIGEASAAARPRVDKTTTPTELTASPRPSNNPNTAEVISPALAKAINELDNSSVDWRLQSPQSLDQRWLAKEQAIFEQLKLLPNGYHNDVHTRQVCERAARYAKAAGLDNDSSYLIRVAATLHDYDHAGTTLRQTANDSTRFIARKDISNEEFAVMVGDAETASMLSIPQRLELQGLILATSFGQANRDNIPDQSIYRPYAATTPAERILAFADIANFDNSFDGWFNAATSLQRETTQRTGETPTFEKWLDGELRFSGFGKQRLEDVRDLLGSTLADKIDHRRMQIVSILEQLGNQTHPKYENYLQKYQEATSTASNTSRRFNEPTASLHVSPAVSLELNDIRDRYYGLVDQQGHISNLAKDVTYLASPTRHPADYADHGVIHAKDVVKNVTQTIDRAHASGLIASRTQLRLDTMRELGTYYGEIHDIGMSDLSVKGRAIHPEFASQEVFSPRFDNLIASINNSPVSTLTNRIDSLASDGKFGNQQPEQILREVLSLVNAHSKSKVPIEILTDPIALEKQMRHVLSNDLETLYCESALAKTQKQHAKEEAAGVVSEATSRKLAESQNNLAKAQAQDAGAYGAKLGNSSFQWLHSTDPEIQAFRDDVIDTLRALRPADSFRQRGTTMRKSGGDQIFLDRTTGDALISYEDRNRNLMFKVRSTDPLSIGEANISESHLTADGNLYIAFRKGGFSSFENEQKVASAVALVVDDIQKDLIESFQRAGNTSNRTHNDIRIQLQPPSDNPHFATAVKEELQALLPQRLHERIDVLTNNRERRQVNLDSPISDREIHRYHNSPLAQHSEQERLRILDWLAANGLNSEGITNHETAFENVRLARILPGEMLMQARTPGRFAYIPLSSGLQGDALGGYGTFALPPGQFVGNTSIIRGAERNADIFATQAVEVLIVPDTDYLAFWHKPYEPEDFANVLQGFYGSPETE